MGSPGCAAASAARPAPSGGSAAWQARDVPAVSSALPLRFPACTSVSGSVAFPSRCPRVNRECCCLCPLCRLYTDLAREPTCPSGSRETWTAGQATRLPQPPRQAFPAPGGRGSGMGGRLPKGPLRIQGEGGADGPTGSGVSASSRVAARNVALWGRAVESCPDTLSKSPLPSSPSAACSPSLSAGARGGSSGRAQKHGCALRSPPTPSPSLQLAASLGIPGRSPGEAEHQDGPEGTSRQAEEPGQACAPKRGHEVRWSDSGGGIWRGVPAGTGWRSAILQTRGVVGSSRLR
ncbi:hypothetical protein J0S82_003312 [Galemys pyrenaicus]|uniref:Uncharacterized protein n=1 Tax=Galemys pyrenaicus TaxID=202257 RepID=A0A8J6A378_GALPY|nr:hypothetical protein J0S82_003312 [Galemys pyrenaicus]